MLRFAFAMTFSLFSSHAFALCSGDSFMDRLTDDERAQVADAVAATPYPRGLVWDATKGDVTLKVVGTMHIHDGRLAAIYDRVKDDVAQADLLLVEATAEEEAKMHNAFASDPNMLFIPGGRAVCRRSSRPRCSLGM